MCIYIYIYLYIHTDSTNNDYANNDHDYTRSPLKDSRLFGPSPWKILAATYEHNNSEQPSAWRKSSKGKS